MLDVGYQGTHQRDSQTNISRFLPFDARSQLKKNTPSKTQYNVPSHKNQKKHGFSFLAYACTCTLLYIQYIPLSLFMDGVLMNSFFKCGQHLKTDARNTSRVSSKTISPILIYSESKQNYSDKYS